MMRKIESIRNRKIIIGLIVIMSISLNSLAQNRRIITIWPNEVPGETQSKSAATVSPTDNGNKQITEVTDPKLEVYTPDEENANGQAIIVCPGGAYKVLAIDLEGDEIATWLTKLGYIVYVLQYRVPNKQTGALQDLQRAIKLVKSEINGEIGIMGFSAGGSLCARAATRFQELTYPKQDEFDTISCRPDYTVLIYPAYLDKGENRSLTPELNVNDDTPPFFIFATADDKYSNSALVMTTALRDKHIPVELHLLPFGGHGYGLRKGKRAAETWPVLLEKWMKE